MAREKKATDAAEKPKKTKSSGGAKGRGKISPYNRFKIAATNWAKAKENPKNAAKTAHCKYWAASTYFGFINRVKGGTMADKRFKPTVYGSQFGEKADVTAQKTPRSRADSSSGDVQDKDDKLHPFDNIRAETRTPSDTMQMIDISSSPQRSTGKALMLDTKTLVGDEDASMPDVGNQLVVR
ncbi:hypothetical protein DFH11DRAFT_1539234 [Phellopilus nigrolimitatus]|nr:hypothetical protein DFH11DRAFT_1539234 [Phellopilus nigrolimitatus]